MNKIKIRVYHDTYGCDTGCCGHRIELDNGNEAFEFEHPYRAPDKKKWAIELAKDIVREKWPKCFNSIDWGNIDFEDVSND